MRKKTPWGGLLIQFRKAHKRSDGAPWTQLDLVNKMAEQGTHVTVATVSRWENGAAITDEHKVAVAKALGVKTSILFPLDQLP